MAQITFLLPDDLAARFDTVAVHGRSKKLRELVAAAVGDTAPPAPPEPGRKSLKLSLRLKAEDQTALDRASKADGLQRTDWVLTVLRRRLFGRPRFGRKEELAIYGAQEDLRRIGVNLNQMARAMNTAVLQGSVLTAELAQLDAFREEIRAHVGSLKDAFRGNLAYWDDEA